MADDNEDKNRDEQGEGGDDLDEAIFEEAEFEAEGWDELSGDPERASRILEALEGAVPDIVKRALAAGMGGLAVSEEKIRSALSDRKVAREIASYVFKHADATKKEILRIVSKEIRDVLEHMDFGEELAKILTTLSLEARVEVRFIPNKDSVRPKASGKVRVKGNKPEDDEGDEEPDGGGESAE